MIKNEDYRDKWLAQNVDDFIGFYSREFYCLDNFSAFKFVYLSCHADLLAAVYSKSS